MERLRHFFAVRTDTWFAGKTEEQHATMLMNATGRSDQEVLQGVAQSKATLIAELVEMLSLCCIKFRPHIINNKHFRHTLFQVIVGITGTRHADLELIVAVYQLCREAPFFSLEVGAFFEAAEVVGWQPVNVNRVSTGNK